MKQRILYVESSRGQVGGSMRSLWTLVRHLDRERFEPRVLIFWDDPFWNRFREAGIPVIHWPGAHSGRLPWQKRTGEPTGTSQPAAPSDVGARRVPGAAHATDTAAMRYLEQPVIRRAASSLLHLLLGDLPLAFRLARLARQEDVHLLHANDRTGSNRFVILAGLLSGRPVVQHERLVAPYRWTDAWLSRRVGATLCVSAQVARQVRENGNRCTRLEVIPDATEPVVAPAAARNGHRKVGIVGRLVAWKGQDLFLQAMQGVAGRWADVEFLVIGSAPPDAAPYERRLRELAGSPALAGRVRFTGFVADPLAVIRGLDLLVVASKTPEPFGLTVIEAMSAGVPVVAPAAGGPAETVEDQVTGLLVPPGDAGALQEAVEELLADPARRRRMGAAGREIHGRRYHPAVLARCVAAVYADLARPAARQGAS